MNSTAPHVICIVLTKPVTIIPPSVCCAFTEQCNCSLTGQVKGHSLRRPCPLTQYGLLAVGTSPMPSVTLVGPVCRAMSAAIQFGGYNPVRTIASPQSSKGTSMGRMSSGGSRMAGVAKRGRFGGGNVSWSLGRLYRHRARTCAPVWYWPAMRWHVTCSISTTCCVVNRKRAALSAPCISLQSCSRKHIQTE